MNLSRRLSACAVGLTILFAAAGRTAQAQTPSEEKAEEKIYALLDEAIAGAQALRLPENRVRFQTAAACLLWPRDEGRARAIIKGSMSTLAALIAEADRNAATSVGRAQAYTVLRFEIVRMVAARDAKLAFDLLRETRQERPAARYANGARASDQELALELTLAAGIAARDAKEAARIAEESLKSGAAAELLNVLGKINASDRGAATRLATATVRRLQSEDLSNDGGAVIVAVGLLNLTRPAQAPPQANTDRADSASPTDARGSLAVDEQTRRDLVNAIVAGAVGSHGARMNNAHLLFNSLPAIMAEVERYAPGQLSAVRAKSDEFRRSLDPSTRAWQKYEGVRRQGSADALLEAAAKAPPEVGDELYADAAFKVLDGGDAERAREIVNNINDPQRRALKSRALEQQLLERSLLRGKLEDAGQRLPPSAPVEERVANLLFLSALAARRQETGHARRFLEEAHALAGNRVRNNFQFTSQLEIARAFSGVEPKQSFAILSELADQLNELLAAAAAVDGFGPDCFEEGELKPFAGNLWGELVRRFGEELAALAPLDVERALSVAQKFQREEVRVAVSLLLAGRVLSDGEARDAGRTAVGAR